ncbi:Transmembrane protein 205 [Balamuthia mandrillaris]
MLRLWPAVHLTLLATWFGMLMWVTWVGGIVMFRNLNRQTFGNVQSKLFPWYFRIGSLCSGTLLAIFLSGHADLWQSLRQGNLSAFTQWSDPRVLQVYALAIALLFTLLNQFVVGPKASSVMFQRHKVEKDSIPEAAKEVQLKQLNKTFGMLHGVSSLLNLVTMIAAFIHVLYLSSRINL